MALAGLLFVMLLIAVFQVPVLVKKEEYRELFMFTGIWLIAGIYASLVVLDIPFISPFQLITKIVEIITGLIT